MNLIQLHIEGGCSTPEEPVRPAILDQVLGQIAIVCQAHRFDAGETIQIDGDSGPQEKLDEFCADCPLNVNPPKNRTEPPFA